MDKPTKMNYVKIKIQSSTEFHEKVIYVIPDLLKNAIMNEKC